MLCTKWLRLLGDLRIANSVERAFLSSRIVFQPGTRGGASVGCAHGYRRRIQWHSSCRNEYGGRRGRFDLADCLWVLRSERILGRSVCRDRMRAVHLHAYLDLPNQPGEIRGVLKFSSADKAQRTGAAALNGALTP